MRPSVAWLVPSLIEGSGGHRTILQHAAELESAGYACSIYLEGAARGSGSAAAEIEHLFGFRFERASFGWDRIAPADLAFATVWYSAQVVRDLPFACRKAYFIQDYEACFNPMGDAHLMAENSYRYGLHPITIGRWLCHHLRNTYRVPAEHFDFCADLDVYRPLPQQEREAAVCFVHQPEKPRRCARLGIEALGIVKARLPQIQVYLYGSTQKSHVWFPHQNLGLLGLRECNALYNRCSAGLCLSSSNPSRIPFEMMAAGLPVVELWRDNTLYDLPQDGVLLCDQTPESIAEGLLQVLNDAERRTRMSHAALEHMRGKPQRLGLEQFVQAVAKLLDGAPNAAAEPLERLYREEALTSKYFAATRPGQAAAGPGVRAAAPERWRTLAGRMVHSSRRLFNRD